MKFIVDEQLPFILADWLQSKGYDAIHVSTLGSDKHVSDSLICVKSMQEKRIVITKDIDFLNTYIVKNQPHKLIYLTTGNLRNRALLDLFRSSLQQLINHLETSNVIELNQHMLKVWF